MEESRPENHDKLNTPRDSRTSQNSRRIWFQPGEVEERNGNQEASKQRVRAQKPQPPKRAPIKLGRGCYIWAIGIVGPILWGDGSSGHKS